MNNYRKTKFSSLHIKKSELIAGIIIFTTNSIALYSFLYLLREAAALTVFIDTTYRSQYDIPFLIQHELYVYNFIIAFISTVFGLNSTLLFIFNKPRKLLQYTRRARLAILNDQRILIYVFLFWLLIISQSFFTMMFLTSSELSHIGLRNNIIISLLGCCIVLLLKSILTIKRYVQNIKTKHLIFTATFIIVVSSFISLYNFSYHNTNIKLVDSGNVLKKYNIELPHSLYCNRHFRVSLVDDIYVIKSTDPEQEISVIYPRSGDIEEYGTEDLGQIIKYSKSSRNFHDAPYVSYNFIIDKHLHVKHLKRVLKEFKAHGAHKISFATIPNNNAFHQRAYFCGINYIHGGLEYPDDFELWQNETVINTLYFHSNNTWSFQGQNYDWKSFFGLYSQIYFHNPNHLNVFNFDEDITYGQFILALSVAYKTSYDARDLLALSRYGLPFEYLSSWETNEVRKVYPIRTMCIVE